MLKSQHLRCPVIAEIFDIHTRESVEENEALHMLANYITRHDIAARLIASSTRLLRRVSTVMTHEPAHAGGDDARGRTAASTRPGLARRTHAGGHRAVTITVVLERRSSFEFRCMCHCCIIAMTMATVGDRDMEASTRRRQCCG